MTSDSATKDDLLDTEQRMRGALACVLHARGAMEERLLVTIHARNGHGPSA